MLSVLLLSGGRRQLFFSLELWLPNKKLWFCVVTFFFKDFCTLKSDTERRAGEWGVGGAS